MLDNILPILSNDSVVAVISDKSQKINNENYMRMEKFKIGKRIVSILKNKCLY